MMRTMLEVSEIPTPLGMLLAAVGDAGLCAVMLGDDAGTLREALARAHPRASIVPAAAGSRAAAAAGEVAGVIDRPGERPTLPLDLRGTPFQRQVWEALLDIPAGTTISYGELAHRVGRPRAIRAAAAACAANRLAVVVPCHRVVGASGSPTGYRWGIERKLRLLQRERIICG